MRNVAGNGREQQRRERLRWSAGRFAAATRSARSPGSAGTESRCGGGAGLAGWRDGGAAVRRTGVAGAAEPRSGRGGVELRKGRWRTGSLVTSAGRGPDQDADREAVPRRLHDRGHLEADARHGWSARSGAQALDAMMPRSRLEGPGVADIKARARLGAHLLRGRGRAGAEAAKGRTWAARRRRRRVRAGGGRVSIAGWLLPAGDRPPCSTTARAPPPQGRAEGLRLERLPGPDHCRHAAGAPLCGAGIMFRAT